MAKKATKPLKTKRKLYWYSLIILLVLAAFSFFVGNNYLKDISAFKVAVPGKVYELKEGSSVGKTVKDLLKDEYPQVFVSLWTTLNGSKYQGIQKGKYWADGSKSLDELLKSMQQGDVYVEKTPVITIIEGMTLNAFLKRMEQQEKLKVETDFLAKIGDPKQLIQDTLSKQEIEAIGGLHDNLEGLLLPATYPYFEKDTNLSMVKKALKHMASFMLREWPKRDPDIILKDPYEALILASIIERESSHASERKEIAAVFYNRMKKRMKLQTDPAVMYGVSPDFKGPLRRSQLNKDTPYNTYMREGLTPTPIAMPGSESILAALHPAKSESLYFVAKTEDPKDGHIFSKNFKDHNKAVAEYRKRVQEYRKSQKDQD